MLVAETIPNHVAMMTGVLPGRSGIVANSIITAADQEEGEDAAQPSLLDPGVETLVTSIEARCPAVQTATVLSKDYLHGIFSAGGGQKQADFHWKPSPSIPVSGHAPDLFTTDAFLGWLDGVDASKPSFAFVNLGDVDRSGHVDYSGGLTGGALPAVRTAVLADTDAQVGRIVSALQDRGMWERTVMVVASDHGMDWSRLDHFVETGKVLEEAGFVRGTAAEGGDAEAPAVAKALADAGEEGIARVVSGPDLAGLGIDHRHAGDVVVFANPGWRMADGDGPENVIPGNHGHEATQHSVLILSGGAEAVAQGSVPGPDEQLLVNPRRRPGNLSVAPTVAALLGLRSPNEPFDAPALSQAFDAGTIPSSGVCGGVATGHGDRTGPSPRVEGEQGAGPAAGVTPATGASLGAAATAAMALVGAGWGLRRPGRLR